MEKIRKFTRLIEIFQRKETKLRNRKDSNERNYEHMLARLEMKLKYSTELTYYMSSLFHGVLMEFLDESFAEYLHQSQLHPYTQHLERKDGSWYWIVTCLNQDTIDAIIHKALTPIHSFKIKKHNLEIEIVHKRYCEIHPKSLMDCFYEEQSKRYLTIHFITPTAFKRHGSYCFYPDLRCIYQSLLNKYASIYQEDGTADTDTFEQLSMDSEIVRYDLKSTNFYLEGVKIPSFIGKITIRFKGTQTMANFADLLFQFGCYSGIGIKTALGMGAINIVEDMGKGKNKEPKIAVCRGGTYDD